MPELLSLALLTAAELSPDWMTLFVGWSGFDLSHWTVELPFDDVRTFALDQLAAAAGTADEWDVFRIADAGATAPIRHSTQVGDVFHGLAKRTGVSVDHALRKWRYAWIYDGVRQVETEPEDSTWASRTESVRTEYFWEKRGDYLYDLVAEWRGSVSENLPPDISLAWEQEGVRENVARLREWLAGEYRALTGEEIGYGHPRPAGGNAAR